MFASLKNKIKEETGSDISTTGSQRGSQNNNRIRSRYSSTMSVNSTLDESGVGTVIDGTHAFEQVQKLRGQCNELNNKVANLTQRLQQLQEEKSHVEKTNEILLESVKVAQTQKDLLCEEGEKIQNLQHAEIEKLKTLLKLREQEAQERLNLLRQNQQQIENLTSELERLKPMEPVMDDLQDELERLRHSTQLEKNNLTTTLAAIEEENRNLKTRLQIVEKSRLESISQMDSTEKMHALLQERKMLEQHLEEAHLQLSDIKSNWSGQNLALETQVNRLSKQVAEETTEKRKAIKARDDVTERVKALEFEMIKLRDEMQQRDNKIKLLEEELDELNLALKECREESEQQVIFERNRAEMHVQENKELKNRLQAAEERFNEYAAGAEQTTQSLRTQNATLQQDLLEVQNKLEQEREEKLTALLRNAEISQSEELLRKELRTERDDANELHEKNEQLKQTLRTQQHETQQTHTTINELRADLALHAEKLQSTEELQHELSEKNKTIRVLNQRVTDLKKTLQQELRSAHVHELGTLPTVLENGHYTATMSKTLPPHASCSNCSTAFSDVNIATNSLGSGSGSIVMDEVNFKYLKHVIVKFLTSREVEARHLIRAVATLLKLTADEEKLLHDTLNWKMSWFGSKPDVGSGQHAFAIPPS